MTTKGPLEDKRELLVRHVIPALDAGIQIKNQSGMTKKRENLYTPLSLTEEAWFSTLTSSVNPPGNSTAALDFC